MLKNHGFFYQTNATNYNIEIYATLVGLLIRLPSNGAARVVASMFFSTDGKTSYATDLAMEHRVKLLKGMMTRINQLPLDDIAVLTKYVVPVIRMPARHMDCLSVAVLGL